MESLADYLRRTDPAFMADTPAPAPCVALEDITDAKTFADAVLASREFRSYILNGLALGNLPAAVLCRMMDYGWGKPPERVEVKDTTVRVEDLTAEHLEDRAKRLAEMARFLRRAEQFDEPLTADSVH